MSATITASSITITIGSDPFESDEWVRDIQAPAYQEAIETAFPGVEITVNTQPRISPLFKIATDGDGTDDEEIAATVHDVCNRVYQELMGA